MAMVVQHNLTAMNSNRQLGVTTGSQAKSSEKLSSGYRINRAGDDAAGLKISEKMRSQVRGLQKASANAQDGVSLIQTAEGALNEAHSILQRMNELAVQGSNDTNQDIDRDAINQELTALTAELDRIASTTQFNKQQLLDGTFTNKKLQVGANTYQNIAVTIGAMNASAIGLTASMIVQVEGEGAKVSATKYMVGSTAFDSIESAASAAGVNSKAGILSNAYVSNGSGALSRYIFGTLSFATAASAQSAVDTAYAASIAAAGITSAVVMEAAPPVTKYMIGSTSYDSIESAAAAAGVNSKAGILSGYGVASAGGGFSKYSINGTSYKTEASAASAIDAIYAASIAAASITSQTTSAAGNTSVVTAPTVSTYEKAQATLSKIQEAINKVSTQRSALGALQNRLEHTIANLDNVAENTQAAESRIRDTDMASEMVEYSKNNILAQAGQSMLAQANQSTQGVLSLLQ